MREVEAFFREYAATFEAMDERAIAALYAYPAHLVSDGGDVALVAVASAEESAVKVRRLLEMYRTVGFRKAKVLALTVEELSPRLRRATVHCGLLGPADRPRYDFDASYVLARFEGQWKAVSAVSHNEMERYRAFLGRG